MTCGRVVWCPTTSGQYCGVAGSHDRAFAACAPAADALAGDASAGRPGSAAAVSTPAVPSAISTDPARTARMSAPVVARTRPGHNVTKPDELCTTPTCPQPDISPAGRSAQARPAAAPPASPRLPRPDLV